MPKLPRTFTNIPLDLLWQYLKVTDELIALADDPQEIRYWTGFHDCMSTLFSDLTYESTKKLYPALADKFISFRIEDQIETMIGDADDL